MAKIDNDTYQMMASFGIFLDDFEAEEAGCFEEDALSLDDAMDAHSIAVAA